MGSCRNSRKLLPRGKSGNVGAFDSGFLAAHKTGYTDHEKLIKV